MSAKPDRKSLELSKACEALKIAQRQRQVTIQSRIMQENRLRSVVAVAIGYGNHLAEGDREAAFTAADEMIERIRKGERVNSLIDTVASISIRSIDELNRYQESIEDVMTEQAKALPVASWLEQPEQRGFGLKSLAVIIGETGDLRNYANPAKVWKRMGCAPHAFGGDTRMGATWKSKGGLPAEEWTNYGYSPRRRSIMYVIGECLVKLNQGPYRSRYIEAKVRAFAAHPEVVKGSWEWKKCDKCKGKKSKVVCPTCGGTGQKCGHAHRHGMLLMTKLLLKNLWIEWNGHPPIVGV